MVDVGQSRTKPARVGKIVAHTNLATCWSRRSRCWPTSANIWPKSGKLAESQSRISVRGATIRQLFGGRQSVAKGAHTQTSLRSRELAVGPQERAPLCHQAATECEPSPKGSQAPPRRIRCSGFPSSSNPAHRRCRGRSGSLRLSAPRGAERAATAMEEIRTSTCGWSSARRAINPAGRAVGWPGGRTGI